MNISDCFRKLFARKVVSTPEKPAHSEDFIKLATDWDEMREPAFREESMTHDLLRYAYRAKNMKFKGVEKVEFVPDICTYVFYSPVLERDVRIEPYLIKNLEFCSIQIDDFGKCWFAGDSLTGRRAYKLVGQADEIMHQMGMAQLRSDTLGKTHAGRLIKRKQQIGRMKMQEMQALLDRVRNNHIVVSK